jgi:hypothetical protein
MRISISAVFLAAILLLALAETANAQSPAKPATESASPSAPVPGKNSFTESQARKRIADAGFIDIGPLTLDPKGIWRASAIKEAAPVTVSLDFQGNVTAR